MVDTVVVNSTPENPSLLEEAKSLGIDVSKLDTSSQSQMADPLKVKVEDKKEVKPEDKSQDDKSVTDDEDKDTNTDEDEQDVDEEVDPEDNPDDDEEGDPKDDDKSDDDDDKAKDVEARQKLVNEMSDKFWSNGQKLDDDDYTKLEEFGYDRRTVDTFIEGRKAVIELQRTRAFTEAGGEDRYWKMVDWARESFSKAEIAEYNKATSADDMNVVLNAVKNLRARFQAENHTPAKRKVTGGKPKGSSVQGYTSLADMQADMRNPRYESDPAFRKRVEQKLAVSSIL